MSGFSLTPPAQALHLLPDLDDLPALAPEREALWSSLEKTSFLTTEEKRPLAGFSPEPGVDASRGTRASGTTWASGAPGEDT